VAEGVDPEACIVRRTNGSTGRPLRIYITSKDQQIRSLVELRSLMRLGLRARDFTVCVGPETPRKRRLHERLGFYDNDRISGNLPPEQQLEQLREMQPSVLWFYPTQLRALMQAANHRLRDHIRPRMLISSAEMFDDLLREQVRDDLGLEPHSAYGANEMGRVAMECPTREGLHINIDHVVLEAWKDGRPARPGEAGAALITTLNAQGMPLLRYRLGDNIRLLDKPCSCGSPLPLMALPEGRESEVIKLPSGRLLSVWAVSNLLREYVDILKFRIVQQELDVLEIELVTREPWPQERLRQIERRTLERLGEPVAVRARLMDELPVDGVKFRYFVCRLPK
jgi:phenylacetate-CoA ligase